MANRASAWWRYRNVIGITVTIFAADVGYEMVSAVLPGFLGTIGVTAAALGWIEGTADALSSFVMLLSGAWSDRLGTASRSSRSATFRPEPPSPCLPSPSPGR